MDRRYIREVRLSEPVDAKSYLSSLPAVRWLSRGNSLSFGSPVTFLVGENGTGKSTLLEGLAVAFGFNAEGGSRNFNFMTSGTHSNLYKHLTLVKNAYPKDGFFLRAESFYNVATNVDELDREAPGLVASYGGRSLHAQSHGESFLALVQNRFRGNGLYILDEPEAALSPVRQMTLIAEIDRLVKQGSQFIIATHSAILMAQPGAIIYQLSEHGIGQVDYKQTEHYILTRRFLEDPARMLRYLLEE